MRASKHIQYSHASAHRLERTVVSGVFGGFGGKKKRVAAGIKLLSPASGLTIATGQGVVKKSSLNFGGAYAWDAGASAAGYGDS